MSDDFQPSAEPLPPVHPGEIVREEFLIPWGIWGVIQGEPVTPVIADLLSRHLGCSVEFWMNLQADYDKRSAP